MVRPQSRPGSTTSSGADEALSSQETARGLVKAFLVVETWSRGSEPVSVLLRVETASGEPLVEDEVRLSGVRAIDVEAYLATRDDVLERARRLGAGSILEPTRTGPDPADSSENPPSVLESS